MKRQKNTWIKFSQDHGLLEFYSSFLVLLSTVLEDHADSTSSGNTGTLALHNQVACDKVMLFGDTASLTPQKLREPTDVK